MQNTFDAAGRRRSPATFPECLAGRPPKNKRRRHRRQRVVVVLLRSDVHGRIVSRIS
jgi:hypothetical protein